MNIRRNWTTKIGFALVVIGGMMLLRSQAPAQVWTSHPFRIVVQGRVSPDCNPRLGDAINMKRCSLRVEISRSGASPSFVVLPWETASVQDAVALDTQAILFVGVTQGGFQQISLYSDVSKALIYSKLTERVSLSPKHDLIAYQAFQPPHGSQTPRVQIEIMPTRNPDLKRPWESWTVFGPSPPVSDQQSATAMRGNALCSSELFWSEDETRVGFCLLNMDSGAEHLVLVPARPPAFATVLQAVDAKSICRNMGQNPDQRCTLVVEQMRIEPAAVEAKLRSTGNIGVKQDWATFPLQGFTRMPNP